jgi:hypothetical protein
MKLPVAGSPKLRLNGKPVGATVSNGVLTCRSP